MYGSPLFFDFKKVVHCVLFYLKKSANVTDETLCKKFFLEKYITPFVIFVKV